MMCPRAPPELRYCSRCSFVQSLRAARIDAASASLMDRSSPFDYETASAFDPERREPTARARVASPECNRRDAAAAADTGCAATGQALPAPTCADAHLGDQSGACHAVGVAPAIRV